MYYKAIDLENRNIRKMEDCGRIVGKDCHCVCTDRAFNIRDVSALA
jgi:hypothetical protein